MSAVFIVLPLALLVVLGAVAAFAWAARHGQFDDLDTPALRMLHDEEERRAPSPPAGPAPAEGSPAPPAGAAPPEEDGGPGRR